MSRLLVQFSHLVKSFGSFSLFEDISLSINAGEFFALIGENGAGKTTLLQLLAGVLPADAGNFSRSANLSIELLPQEICVADEATTVKRFLEEPLGELERKMAVCLEDPSRLAEWEKLHERYEKLGGYQRIPTEKLLTGLKLDAQLIELPMSSLSSGQKLRVALAKTLAKNPELLLLDEPTNHLDQEMIEWLEVFLSTRKGACIIISHDRKFLDKVCNRLIEVKNGKLAYYGGNYTFYLQEQQRISAREIKAYEAQQEEKAFLKQKIKAMTSAKRKPSLATDRNTMAYDKRGEKHQKSIQYKLGAMKKKLADIEAHPLSHPKPKSMTGLRFSSPPLTSSTAIEIEHISKAYGNRILFSDFCQTIRRKDRILVKGSNGCGKTTLLQAIAGMVALDEGIIRYNSSVKIAFLDQEVAFLPEDRTPLDYFHANFQLSEEELRRELHKGALGGEEKLTCVFGLLSTGQRKRMMLLKLILEKPNVLLLDEPTNHLDFMTLEALEKSLIEFEGAIVAVSHDATFSKKFSHQEWIL